jgi:thiol:disulfide interchange protein
MLRRVGLVVAIGAAVLLTGCANKAASSSDSAAPGSSSPSAAITPTAAAETVPDPYDPARNPAADLKAALTLAAADHKEVLIDFGAYWCPDCRALEKMFLSEQTRPLLQRDFIVVPVDVGDFNLNLSFAAQYVNLQTSGIPALVVLTSGGKIRVATNDGSFENARTMNNNQVNAFLALWAPGD